MWTSSNLPWSVCPPHRRFALFFLDLGVLMRVFAVREIAGRRSGERNAGRLLSSWIRVHWHFGARAIRVLFYSQTRRQREQQHRRRRRRSQDNRRKRRRRRGRWHVYRSRGNVTLGSQADSVPYAYLAFRHAGRGNIAADMYGTLSTRMQGNPAGNTESFEIIFRV